MVITLLVALLVAEVAGSETLLTYGPPFVQSPQGFSLFDMAGKTFLKVPPTIALLAPGKVHGLLSSLTHLVLYGGFNWIMIDDAHTSVSNLAVLDVASGTWAALTPSVFGKEVFDATWRTEGKQFFVVGQLHGLDTAPGSDLVGVALCMIGGGCSSVQEGLNNVPVSSASIAWNAAKETLTVVWQGQPGAFSLASWSNAAGWSFRDLPSQASSCKLFHSASDRFVLALENFQDISMESWICGTQYGTTLGLVTAVGEGVQGCWYEVQIPSDMALPHPMVCSASGILYTVGIVARAEGNYTVGVRRFVTTMEDITYNLEQMVQIDIHAFDPKLLHMRVYGETVLFMFVSSCSANP